MEDNRKDAEHVLRERFFYHYDRILSGGKLNHPHFDVCMELKKVAKTCGYTALAKEMHSFVWNEGFRYHDTYKTQKEISPGSRETRQEGRLNNA